MGRYIVRENVSSGEASSYWNLSFEVNVINLSLYEKRYMRVVKDNQMSPRLHSAPRTLVVIVIVIVIVFSVFNTFHTLTRRYGLAVARLSRRHCAPNKRAALSLTVSWWVCIDRAGGISSPVINSPRREA